MDASNSLVIETRNLSKAYKGVRALKDFNLKLTPGIVGGQWSWAVFGLGLILLSAYWRGSQVRV